MVFQKILLLTCFLLLSHTAAKSQNFVALQGTSAKATVALQQVNEVYIFFERKNVDKVQLSWKRIDVQKPTSWFFDLCDLGACYTGIPGNGTMDILKDSIIGYLKLIVRPEDTEGWGRADFRVFETDNPSSYLDVTFEVSTAGFVTTSMPCSEAAVLVYPNPSTGVLHLKAKSDKKATYSLSAVATGQQIWTGILNPHTLFSLDLSNYPKGVYLLLDGSKKPVQKILIL